ncbi:hypothetical protein [Myxococcus xanthus]|uniref:hypothetical protein n=1 Tax=Myxococcus xanthus TaxID=34 RepID=UPI0020A34A39|nr:hypothetical protein [Myxococcus xanthus]
MVLQVVASRQEEVVRSSLPNVTFCGSHEAGATHPGVDLGKRARPLSLRQGTAGSMTWASGMRCWEAPVTPVQAVLEAGVRAQARGCSQSLDLTEEARAAFAADASP